MTAREICDSIVLTVVGLILALMLLGTVLGMWAIVGMAHARDNGQYAQTDPSIRGWFNGLRNQNGGQCCSFADGFSIDDPDWDVKGGHYRARIKGVWFEVPPEAVVGGPNRIGRAVVWPYDDEAGKTFIRCFMPGVEG